MAVNGAMSTWGFSSVSTSHLTQNTPMKADDFFFTSLSNVCVCHDFSH